MGTADANATVGENETIGVHLYGNVAEWYIEAYVDSDGHLNLLVRDLTGGGVENIREESNTTCQYDELLLRYTSSTIEEAYAGTLGDYIEDEEDD